MKKTDAKKEKTAKTKREAANKTAKKQKPAENKEQDNSTEDYITMDMPEVKDIPGQEKIRPPKMREMMDITPSSADEEGEGLLDDLNKAGDEDEIVSDENGNVSSTEKRLLRKAGHQFRDEERDVSKMRLDDSDGEDALNEKSNPRDMGKDLDVPGAELDDEDEQKGEEDEENNSYSRPD